MFLSAFVLECEAWGLAPCLPWHAGVVMSGSHGDSIQLGGAYDGALGVLGAIAAIKALRGAGFKPMRSLEAMMFTTEEAGRFNVPCLGRWVCREGLDRFQTLA